MIDATRGPAMEVTPNDLVAFVVEVAALGALSTWGFRTGPTPTTSWLLGVGAPLVAAVAWGLFAAPRARFDVPVLAVVTKLVVLGAALSAARTLLAPGWWALAVVVVVVNTVLLFVGPWAR